ncbi:hypothetical protein PAMP_024326 [Pampus punctatissimus]
MSSLRSLDRLASPQYPERVWTSETPTASRQADLSPPTIRSLYSTTLPPRVHIFPLKYIFSSAHRPTFCPQEDQRSLSPHHHQHDIKTSWHSSYLAGTVSLVFLSPFTIFLAL